jgi:ABC-2 type transport system permease protein
MRILTIIKYDFIKLTRDKLALMFMIAMPVVFTLILGSVFGGDETVDMNDRKLGVAVTDYDKSELSERLLEEFEKDESTYISIMSEEKLRDSIKSAYYQVGFIIPKGFEKSIRSGEKAIMNIVKLPASADYMAMQTIMSNSFSSIMIGEGIIKYIEDELKTPIDKNTQNMIKQGFSAELGKPDSVTIDKTRYYKDQKSFQYNGKAQLSMGYLVMFVMFAVVFGAGEILDERKINTWDRLAIAPVGMGKVISGKLLSNYIRGALQIAFLIAFGALVMGVSWGNSILATVILSIAFLFAATGMGTLLSSLVKTNSQLGSFGTIVLLVTTSISGCWWPIELSPEIMQKIAMAFPQYWAMAGYKNTVVANLGISSIIEPSLILMAMAALFYTVTLLIGGFKFSKSPVSTEVSLADD